MSVQEFITKWGMRVDVDTIGIDDIFMTIMSSLSSGDDREVTKEYVSDAMDVLRGLGVYRASL